MYCSYINVSIPIYIHPYIDVYMHVFSGNYIKRIKPAMFNSYVRVPMYLLIRSEYWYIDIHII